MSIIQFLRILMARRWIILGCLVGVTLIALAVGSRLPERYPASARVMLDVIKPDPVTGSIIASQFVRGYTRTQTELIKDYRVAGEVVDRLKIAERPEAKEMFAKQKDFTGDIRRFMAQKIIDRTEAGMISGSNILEIQYEAANPDVAKTTVGAIRDAYIDASLRFRTDSAGRTADWFRQQAEKAQAELVKAETAKSNFERANGLVMGAGGGDAETSKLQGLQQALLAARTSTGAQEIRMVQTEGNSGLVESVRAQLAATEDALQQASAKLGTAHPTYLALQQRRSSLQAQLSREIAASRALGGNVANAARRSVSQIEAEYNAQKAKVLGMKDKLDQLGALQREVDLRRSQYERAAARTADLKLQADVDETGLVPLGASTGSASPSFPNMPLIGALAALGGLTLGLVIAIVIELLGRRVRGSEDMIAAAKVPVLAIIADAQPSPFRDWVRKLLTRGRTNDALQPAQ